MNGYIAMFDGKQVEIWSDTSYHAHLKAMEHFRPSKAKRHLVHVMLAEVDGVPVVHRADF